MDAPNFLRTIETAIAAGRPVIVENLTKKLHPELYFILILNDFYSKKDESVTVNFGGKDIQYNDGFRLYITTPISQPELTEAEKCRLNIIDFSLTKASLEEQLISLTVRQERSDIQQQKDSLSERILTDKR